MGNAYAYTLHKQPQTNKVQEKRYCYSELIKMTTYQLREICRQEKLVKSVLDPLNKEELIHLIMRYRGKDEASYIKTFNEEGMDRLEAFLQKTQITWEKSASLQVPSKLVLYEGIGVEVFDEYVINANIPLTEGNVLIVDENNTITTIFNLLQMPNGKYYLTKTKEVPIKQSAKKGYAMLYLEKKESEFLYTLYQKEQRILPKYFKVYKMPILDLQVKALEETQIPLVIDFGTANTTAGIYEETRGFQTVEVLHKKENEFTFTPIIPSVIGMESIEGENIEYVFGYEAIALSRVNYIDEGLHIFYDIKRWVSDYERLEKLTAADGHHTWIKRKELLKAFLEYIIELANQRFKCRFKNLQLLSPVRQKGKFQNLFQSLLQDYTVACDIDEGVAVLFNTICKLLQEEKYEQNTWYRALIIDCGGGTTDLSSCQFKIQNNRVSYTIDIQSSYENGDTNFGGNNLTFRVFQYIKVMLAAQLQNKNNVNQGLLLQEQVKGYEKLQEAYEEAEAILPTQFKKYENKSPTEYFRVKSNFYHLFEVAEQIKKRFFMGEPVYELTLHLQQQEDKDKKQAQEDRRRGIILVDKWKLSFMKNNELLPLMSLEPTILSIYEVAQLLRPDVYKMMKKFLEEEYQKGELIDYQMIKLTGQSCQMELFKEALKEYIPGKLIQTSKNEQDSYDLKLSCIYGALQYFQGKKLGYMRISHKDEGGAFPYEVTAYTHENKEKILIYSLDKKERTGAISRFMGGVQLNLYLKDTQGKVLREYFYEHRPEDFKQTTYYEVQQDYGEMISQDETDTIVNGESKFFVWPDRKAWGFYVLPILRETDTLYKGKIAFFDFENDTWEENFFDGSK
jgi:hypothetical protein